MAPLSAFAVVVVVTLLATSCPPRLSWALNPVAECTFPAGAPIQGTVRLETMRQSSLPPYNYGASVSYSLTGASNNTWWISKYADSTCTALGPMFVANLTDRNGGLSNSSSFTDADLELVGPRSVIGRSIVVASPSNPNLPIACCNILLTAATPDVNDPLEPTGYNSTAVTCTFHPVAGVSVSGTAVIRSYYTETTKLEEIGLQFPPKHWGSQIEFPTGITHDLSGNLAYHIHEFPPTRNGACGPTVTGDHYNPPEDKTSYINNGVNYGLSELSNKHGLVSNVSKSFVDHAVRLDGPFGVAGRSIVLHHTNGTRVACCLIPFVDEPKPAIGPEEDEEAICVIPPGGDVTGTIHFKQPSRGPFGTVITTRLTFESTQEQGGFHDWRIHTISSGTNVVSGECDSSGAVYAPGWTGIGPSGNGVNSVPLGLGHLGNKLGFIDGRQAGSSVSFEDGGVVLVGPGSIVGRSLKIESRNDSIANLRTLGCCNIVRVPKGSVQQSPRTAVCDFGSQTVGGKITFQQAYEEGGSTLTFELSGSVNSVDAWHVHDTGVTADDCATTGGHYNPIPNLGELSARLGKLNATGSIRDSMLQLSGPYSILGRAITLHGGDQRIACCSIGLVRVDTGRLLPNVSQTAGADPVVRYQYAGLESTCSFSALDLQKGLNSDDEAEGFVRFRQLTTLSGAANVQLGTEVEVSIIGMALKPGLKLLSIRQDPFISSCSSTGDVFAPNNGLTYLADYGVGFVSNRHGRFSADRWQTRFIDNTITLVGEHSVVNRSILIEDTSGSPLACCNIGPATTHPDYVAIPARGPSYAACIFDEGPAKGTFVIEDNGALVEIYTNVAGFYFDESEEGEHNFHIHQHGTTDASKAGAHFKPFDGIGPDANGIAFPTYGIIEIGDLSGKHGKLQPRKLKRFVDNQVRLSGPFSVLGRSIVIHNLEGTPMSSCMIVAVSPDYYPVDPEELTTGIRDCKAGETFREFTCRRGTFEVESVTINSGDTVTWKDDKFLVNRGATVKSNATLTVNGAYLRVNTFFTISSGGTVIMKPFAGSHVSNYKNYGGKFDLKTADMSVEGDWEEPVCNFLNEPDAAASQSYPIPYTVIDAKTNVTITGSFEPCGTLQVVITGTPDVMTPFKYGSINGKFTKIQIIEDQDDKDFTVTPTYGDDSLQLKFVATDTTQGLTILIVGLIVGAVVVAIIIIAVLVIVFTPAGIPCRIWYRKTCGKKFNPSGRNTTGF